MYKTPLKKAINSLQLSIDFKIQEFPVLKTNLPNITFLQITKKLTNSKN